MEQGINFTPESDRVYRTIAVKAAWELKSLCNIHLAFDIYISYEYLTTAKGVPRACECNLRRRSFKARFQTDLHLRLLEIVGVSSKIEVHEKKEK